MNIKHETAMFFPIKTLCLKQECQDLELYDLCKIHVRAITSELYLNFFSRIFGEGFS